MTPAQFLARLDPWVLGWCALLVLCFLWALTAMAVQARRVLGSIRAAERALLPLSPEIGEDRRYGRSQEAFERLQVVAKKLGDAHTHWWSHVDDALEKYESPEERQGYFVTRPVDDLVTTEDLTRGYSWSTYHAIPGVLTTLGLLGTFIAILLGLNGLRMDPNAGTVTGLDALISNLSGKFLTSIVALGLSVVFLMVELIGVQPRLRRARQRLVSTLAGVLPYLSPSRLLLDIQRQSVKQSSALGHISADVVDKFANVFREDLAPVFAAGISSSMASELRTEMGPTLIDLRGTMQELSATVRRLEESKQESVVGELHGLLGALEQSLRDTLADMGRQFQSALTGSTKDEFGALADVIKGSASVVEAMNSNFTTLQSTLQAVVDEARSTTTAQMRAGSEQTERLNSLVEGLMVRLNDTASQNYQQLTGTLTSVVSDLSTRVSDLSADLVKTVGSATAHSQQAASETMKQAGDWSSQTNKQLQEVLSIIQRQSADFERASAVLVSAQSTLQSTLEQNNRALGTMHQAAGEVKAYTSGLAGLQRQIADGQQEQARLATMSRDSVAKLNEAAARQERFLKEYETTLQQHQRAFATVDTQVAQVLETILQRQQTYNRTVEQNFRTIVESANSVMPRMANVLKASTDELKEHLDELNDVLGKGAERLATARAR
jgi:hypothetical protein